MILFFVQTFGVRDSITNVFLEIVSDQIVECMKQLVLSTDSRLKNLAVIFLNVSLFVVKLLSQLWFKAS